MRRDGKVSKSLVAVKFLSNNLFATLNLLEITQANPCEDRLLSKNGFKVFRYALISSICLVAMPTGRSKVTPAHVSNVVSRSP